MKSLITTVVVVLVLFSTVAAQASGSAPEAEPSITEVAQEPEHGAATSFQGRLGQAARVAGIFGLFGAVVLPVPGMLVGFAAVALGGLLVAAAGLGAALSAGDGGTGAQGRNSSLAGQQRQSLLLSNLTQAALLGLFGGLVVVGNVMLGVTFAAGGTLSLAGAWLLR